MTNKPRRKRAPGGGRKAAGPFSNKLATLSTRITQETRNRLEQATARRRAERGAAPWSLSQEIETRLRQSLDLPEKLKKAEKEWEEAWGPPHIRALAQLVSRLVRNIEREVGAGPPHPFAPDKTVDFDLAWHRDPYTHQAVTTAIARLLAHYKPAGEVRIPKKIKQWAEQARSAGEEQVDLQQKPESTGLACARALLATWEVPLSEGGVSLHFPSDILEESRK